MRNFFPKKTKTKNLFPPKVNNLKYEKSLPQMQKKSFPIKSKEKVHNMKYKHEISLATIVNNVKYKHKIYFPTKVNNEA